MFTASWWAQTNASRCGCLLGINWYNEANTYIGDTWLTKDGTNTYYLPPGNNTWVLTKGFIYAMDGASYGYPMVHQSTWTGSATVAAANGDSWLRFTDVTIQRQGIINADLINAGTLTGRTIQTASSGKRMVVSSTDGEMHFYDTDGTTELCNIGLSTYQATDDLIVYIGHPTMDKVGLLSITRNNVAIKGVSYASSPGVWGFSLTGLYGVYGEAVGSGSAGLYGYGTKGYGCRGNGALFDFYGTGSHSVGYGPFTGGHDGLIKKNCILAIGDILEDVETIYHSNISNTISEVAYTTSAMSKRVIGVLVLIVPFNQNVVPSGLKVSSVNLGIPEYDKLELIYNSCVFNALGEGQLNVCKDGGNIEAGDYICSSNRPGKGMKQDDDLLHNYTVAKAREDCIWLEDEDNIRMIACTYHCG